MDNPRTATQAVVQEIRAELARRRLTIKDLSEMVGMEYLNLWRRLDANRLTLDELLSLTLALDLDLPTLIDRTAA
jgi:hypothetical protein